MSDFIKDYSNEPIWIDCKQCRAKRRIIPDADHPDWLVTECGHAFIRPTDGFIKKLQAGPVQTGKR